MNQVAAAGGVPRIVEIRQYFIDRSDELRAALGEIPVEMFVRAIVTSLQLNPDLLECRTKSLWNAAMKACRDQLLPDGIEAAFVPYKDQCQYIPMYQGMLRRFRRSGQFRWITAGVVREGEEFHHFIDESGEHFRHVPGDDDAPVKKAYAIAITKDGATFVAVLSVAELQRVRAFSKAKKDDAPWKVWPEEMQKKSAIRRLSKLLPSVRDLMPGGDDDEPLPPALAPPVAPGAPASPAELPARRTPQLVLDQFAQRPADAEDVATDVDAETQQADASGGGSADKAAAPASKQRPGDLDGPPADAAGGDAGRAPASDPAAAAGEPDPIRIAYRRGQDWRVRGNGRKAVPPEYRNPDRQREAIAWTAGFDGSALPTWPDEESAP